MSTTIRPRTATIPIYQGDDSERLAELRMTAAIADRDVEQKRAQLVAAEAAASSARYGDEPDVTSEDVAAAEAKARGAWDAYEAFVTEAAERAVSVVVQHIGRLRFRDLVAEHPERIVKDDDDKDVPHDDDYDFGVNTDTFSRALLAYVDDEDNEIRTITAPEFKGKKPLEAFIDDELNEGDFTRVWQAAYWLNRAPSADPKALASSRSTSATSE